MKRFIFQIIIMGFIVVLVDVCCGFVFNYAEKNAKGGMTCRDNYICDSLMADILISGSSRCMRHYNPQIVTDSLGCSCYNLGQLGNGIILNYGRLLMVGERQKPRLVIYDVTPNFDLLLGDDNHRYLTWLKGHYDRDGIEDIFLSVDKNEKYKMMSQLYRYNSRFVEILSDFAHPLQNARNDGYSPLKGKLNRSKLKTPKVNSSYQYDPLKLEYLEKYIHEIGDDHIVFTVSPCWYGMDSIQFQPLKDICRERKIPFLDFSNNAKYVHNDLYFRDGKHMNVEGADEFTKDLISAIRDLQFLSKQSFDEK